MKDLLGNELKVGDKVATSVMSYKRDRVAVGVIESIDGAYLSIKPVEGGTLVRSIIRRPADVVKVSA